MTINLQCTLSGKLFRNKADTRNKKYKQWIFIKEITFIIKIFLYRKLTAHITLLVNLIKSNI